MADTPMVNLTIEGRPVSVPAGTSILEAAKVAESNGWTLRSARIDGVEQALTDDLQWNRINIAVDAGIVTEIVAWTPSSPAGRAGPLTLPLTRPSWRSRKIE